MGNPNISEAELLQKAQAFARDNQQAMVADLQALVAFPSVAGAAAPGAPFGSEVRAALDWMLARARAMGLQTNDGDGYVGWADLPGEQTRHIATITHLDVVPAAEGWAGSPWQLRQTEGWLIGRGVADDKGPAIVCLYLAKFFRELGQPLRYGLRALFGCSEETGMQDVGYYLERNEQPAFCFSPDAEFPVCHAEKGVMGGNLSAPLGGGRLVAFEAGVASNVIPDSAWCVVRADPAALPPTDRVRVEPAQDGCAKLTAAGVGGHAAFPEGTVNAIGLLVDYLLENHLCTEQENRFLALLARLHAATDGSGLGIATSDQVFGALTCIGGMIELKDGALTQNLNIRFPTSTSIPALTAALEQQAAEAGATFQYSGGGDEPFHLPVDAPAVQALLGAYNQLAGQNEAPYTMGGGTYARHFRQAVAYGPAPPAGQLALPDFAGPEHAANEGARLEDLLLALRVYILAVWRLQGLEL